MAYTRKTKDEYDLMTDYGYGEEAECTYNTYAEALADYKTYKNEKAAGYLPELRSVRIKHRLVPISKI